MSKSEFRQARKNVEVTPGESVRIIRELQELSQNELSNLTGIPQSTISAIENGRINLGVERAKILARALRCHPAVLVFPRLGSRQRDCSLTFRNSGSRPLIEMNRAPFKASIPDADPGCRFGHKKVSLTPSQPPVLE
jgi:transcriptional regulator with XRE-family HTH domain